MAKKNKDKKSDWFIAYVGSVPTGVSEVIEANQEGTYSKAIVETILPETEEEWEAEKDETMRNLRLIVESKNMYTVLKQLQVMIKNGEAKIPSTLKAKITQLQFRARQE